MKKKELEAREEKMKQFLYKKYKLNTDFGYDNYIYNLIKKYCIYDIIDINIGNIIIIEYKNRLTDYIIK